MGIAVHSECGRCVCSISPTFTFHPSAGDGAACEEWHEKGEISTWKETGNKYIYIYVYILLSLKCRFEFAQYLACGRSSWIM
jgi:hypothetical protein